MKWLNAHVDVKRLYGKFLCPGNSDHVEVYLSKTVGFENHPKSFRSSRSYFIESTPKINFSFKCRLKFRLNIIWQSLLIAPKLLLWIDVEWKRRTMLSWITTVLKFADKRLIFVSLIFYACTRVFQQPLSF